MISLPGKITSITSDTKKTVVKYELSTEVKYADMIEIQKLIGLRVFADFHNAQQELDDLDDEDHERIGYSVDKSGVASVNPDQASIDDFIENSSDQENTEQVEEQSGDEEEPQEDTEGQQPSQDALPDLTEDPEIDPEDLPFPVDEDGPGF